MDITPYVENLRHDLSATAEAGGPETRAAADRLLLALDPALRMTLMEALSEAAALVTSELPAGSVEVRLKGREPELVVDVPSAEAHRAEPPAQPVAPDDEADDDGAIARITLRIPESVKARAEELAGRSGHSLNGWIVSVLRAATSQRAVNVDIDLSSIPFLDDAGPFAAGRRGSRRMTGWI